MGDFSTADSITKKEYGATYTEVVDAFDECVANEALEIRILNTTSYVSFW